MTIPFRWLIVPLLLAASAREGAAQRYAFQEVSWGLSADSVRARVTALGFTFDTRVDDGDLDFRRADGAVLRAEFQRGRLVGFTMIDAAPGAQVQDRYRTVADSLRAVLGPPDEEDEQDFDLTLWEAGLSSVRMHVFRNAGVPYLQLAWRGPGWFDEMNQRGGLPPQPPGFITVSHSQFMRMAVDTTGGGPRGSGTLRGRFRVEYYQPVTPKVNGVDGDPLDAVVYEMELDCAARRARLIARATYLEGRRTLDERPDSRTWSTPAPDGHYARGLDAVCRAARRGR